MPTSNNQKQMCCYPRCLWMSTDASLGAGLHSHSHALSLSVSPCVCPHFVSYKNPSSANVRYHWNTRFDCIRLFSFHKGSTNTKLVSPDWDEKSSSRLRTKTEKVKMSRKSFVKTLAFSTLVKITSVVILTLSTHTTRRESQDPHRRYHGCCCPSWYGRRA